MSSPSSSDAVVWLRLANAVADKDLGVASQHISGTLPITLDFERAFEGKFDFGVSQ